MELRIITEPQQGAHLRRPARGRAHRRGARLRGVLPLRPLPRDGHRRAARADRRVDHARRARPRHEHDPARHPDDLRDLPAPGPARDRRRRGRPDERRPGRLRHRRGLVRRRAHGVRHPVPGHRASGSTGSRSSSRSSPASGRRRRARRSATTAATTSSRTRRPCPSRPEPTPAGPARRHGQAAHARARREVRRRVQPAFAPRPTPSSSSAGSGGPARPRTATRTSLTYSNALTVCVGADEDELARRAKAIGRDVADLRANALGGTPQEVVDKLSGTPPSAASARTSRSSTSRDLDHLRLVAEEVAPHV